MGSEEALSEGQAGASQRRSKFYGRRAQTMLRKYPEVVPERTARNSRNNLCSIRLVPLSRILEFRKRSVNYGFGNITFVSSF